MGILAFWDVVLLGVFGWSSKRISTVSRSGVWGGNYVFWIYVCYINLIHLPPLWSIYMHTF